MILGSRFLRRSPSETPMVKRTRVESHDQTGPDRRACPSSSPSPRSPSGWPRPPRWPPTSATACSTTSPRSPTPDTGAADGTRWSPCFGVTVCAVLAGARSLAAIGEWAADAPRPVLAALGVRRHPLTGAFRPPGEATVRRVLACVDPDALDQVIGAWLAGRQPPHRPDGHCRGGRSRSTARPCAAAATTSTRRCTCSR